MFHVYWSYRRFLIYLSTLTAAFSDYSRVDSSSVFPEKDPSHLTCLGSLHAHPHLHHPFTVHVHVIRKSKKSSTEWKIAMICNVR